MGIANLANNVGITLRTWDDIDARKEDREYQKEMRKLQLQRGTADNALLEDRNAAARAKYGLDAEQASTERRQLPNKAALAGVKTDIDLAQANQEKTDLPTTLAGDSAKRKSDSFKAQYTLAADKFNLDELPSKLKAMRQQGAIDDATRAQHVLAGLVTAMRTQDPKVVLNYANKALAENDHDGFPTGDTVVNVRQDTAKVNGQDVPVWAFETESGKQMVIRQDAAIQAYKAVNPPKREKLNAGDTIVESPADGGPVSEVYRAPKWKMENGIAQEEGTGEIKQLPGGGVTPEQARALTNDGVNQIGMAFGAKLDPVSKMMDPETINDPDGYYKAIKEAEQRIRAGEKPMAVAADIALRAKKKAAVDATRGGAAPSAPPGSASTPMSPVDRAASKFKF